MDESSLSLGLMDALACGQGMNDFLSRSFEAVARHTGVEQLVLFDYNEYSDRFELLYFCGFANDARSVLHRLLPDLDIRQALRSRSPFTPPGFPELLLVPLYFQDALEAVLMIGSPHSSTPGPVLPGATTHLISKFLGLFMSSTRLPMNRRAEFGPTDLARAREIQMSFLPASHRVTESYEIFGFNKPSALVGGDYFDYFSQRERSVQCVVADACGHGMAAALIMTNFRGMLQAEVSRLDEFETLFTNLNRRLYSGGDLVQYLTCVFFAYDEATARLRYFNAGHFDPVLVHEDGTASRLPGGGPPLGMFDFSSYRHQDCDIRHGDLMVLFTDGLVELRNPRDEFFGMDRIIEFGCASRNKPLSETAREILSAAARFSGQTEADDDITLFLMKFR